MRIAVLGRVSALLFISALVLLVGDAGASDCSPQGCVDNPVWYRVTVNGQFAGDALGVVIPDRPGLWLESVFVEQSSVLQQFVSLVRQIDGEAYTSLDAMRQIRYRLTQPGVVDIRVPARLLGEQRLGAPPKPAGRPVQRGRGFRLAYDAFASSGLESAAAMQSSVFLEGNAFAAWGNARSSALLSDGVNTQRVRLDTAWEKEWLTAGIFSIVGDHLGPPDAFGRQPRRAGFSIRRAFEFEPERIRYPLPLLQGASELPATVDLYVDNVRRDRYEVDGGAFTIAQPAVTAGAGTAQIVVTNILGEQVIYEQPFFVSPRLLNPGLWDFTFSLGAQRENYAQRSFDYGSLAATMNWRYGLSSRWTTDGSVHLGADSGILELGTAGIPAAQIPLRVEGGLGAYRLESEESGVLVRTGWSWQAQSWFADMNHRQAIASRVPTAESRLPYKTRQFMRLGLRVRRTAVSANYIRRDSPQLAPFRQWIFRTAWNPRRSFGGQMTAEIFRTTFGGAEPRDVGIRLNWIWSPKTRQQSSFAAADEGQASWQHQWMRTGDLGSRVNVQARREAEGHRAYSADLDYQTSQLGARARVVSATSGDQLSAGVRGSVGWVEGRRFVGRDPGRAFALVDLNGLSDTTIFRDNQPVAVSDHRGLALIPGLRPYQDNRIHLNPADIPLDWRLPSTQKIVRPGVHAGVLLAFDTAPQRSASLRLFQAPGRPVPAGAQITTTDGSIAGYAAAQGRVYVSGLLAGANRLQVTWPGGACQVQLDWPATGGSNPQLGDIQWGDIQRGDIQRGDMLCR